MSWFDWVLVVLWGLSALMTIGTVGKPRKRITSGDAVVLVLIDVVLIVLLLATRGVLS